MSSSDRRVIALGNLAGELKTALEGAARGVGLELLLTREPARAFVELERDGALAVLVDMATLGAEQFCKRARGTERLRSVPVIGMSRHPNELGFARVFAWGADDLVPLGARLPLEHRLQVLRDTPHPDASGFGQAVVAEATTQRRALVGRVLSQAGYDVKFAVDRGAVELYASQSETRLVVISAALGDPRRIIEAAAKAGALPTWIVTVEARSTARLAASLAGLDRVAVTSTAGSPEDVLFLANELVFSKGPRRREWRALYGTPVAFRPSDGDADEYGFSYDASPRGLYVRSLLPCATEDVEVELRLPNRDERVRLHGKVAKRFPFGSGAIASAPPGFGVKLEGPDADLSRWDDACGELIDRASSESLPPARPRSPSQPVLQSPGFGAKEVSLAVPPATVSIESVVAPLPIAVQAGVAEGTDVGELLAATLDEQTLTEVGTRPVTIGRDGGVREERASEFGASLPPPLDATETPLVGETLLKSIAPVLAPPSAAPPAEPDATPVEPPPPSPHAMDWDADDKTTVRASQPNMGEAPTQRPPEDIAPPSEPAPTPVAVQAPEPPVLAADATASPGPARAAAAASPFAATILGPPPVPRRAMASSPGMTAAPQSSRGASPNPPAVTPQAPPVAPLRSASEVRSTKQTLPMGFQRQPPPQQSPPQHQPPAPQQSAPQHQPPAPQQSAPQHQPPAPQQSAPQHQPPTPQQSTPRPSAPRASR
ncbi:MAG TPA: hypothetical protein VGQ57_00160, partial [Polyangiaceae bacterium]|nr:hypothetical protein [Polyangiaceae bacterium]